MEVSLDFSDEKLSSLRLSQPMLREFTQLMVDSVNPDALGMSKKSTMFSNTVFQKTATIVHAIATSVARACDAAADSGYAMDYTDVSAVLAQEVHKTISRPAANKAITAMLQKPFPDNSQLGALDATEKSAIRFAQNKMDYNFSLCLALEHGRENDLLAKAEKMRSAQKIYAENIIAPDVNKHQTYLHLLAIPIVLAEQELAAARNRQSPAGDLMEQLQYGEDYLMTRQKRGAYTALDNVMQMLYDRGNHTSTGTHAIEQMRNNALGGIRTSLGIESRHR
ncbi:MAG: hypothetical protein AB7L92_05140 [Alphaproteobacteria bacterium]